jgi:hypothetical protein
VNKDAKQYYRRLELRRVIRNYIQWKVRPHHLLSSTLTEEVSPNQISKASIAI